MAQKWMGGALCYLYISDVMGTVQQVPVTHATPFQTAMASTSQTLHNKWTTTED